VDVAHRFQTAHLKRLKCPLRYLSPLPLAILLMGSPPLAAQDVSTCVSPDWFAVQKTQPAGARLSPLCVGELHAAEDHREAAESELRAVIAGDPQSTDAYEARSTLEHLYFRIGRFRDANAQIDAMLRTHPTAPDLLNLRSLLTLLASYPNFSLAKSSPASVRTEMFGGNVFAPVTVEGAARSYMLDTGMSISMMTRSEAKSLGLTPRASTTSMNDISGLASHGLQIVEVDRLVVGATELRHIPFMVVEDTHGAFVGIPDGRHGILGIQPLAALGILAFHKDGTLSLGQKAGHDSKSVPLLFAGEMPLSQIAYHDQLLTVTFDMGATQTTLNPFFGKLHPELLKEGQTEDHTMNGVSGSTTQRSVSLRHIELVFGRKVDLAPATILLNQTTGTSDYSAANLGYDLMQQARPFTIDFRRMLITFPPAQ